MTTALPTTMPANDLAITTAGVRKSYGKHVALRDLALQVPTGAVYLLVGHNGAGKSTTLKLLLDLVRAEAGSVDVFGLDARRNGPAIRANIGYVPESSTWGYDWMTAGSLIQHHSQYFSSWDADYAKQLCTLFDLRLDQALATLSKGQARRVHLTMALAHRPPLLLLDEPTDGLDPVMRDEALGALADHLAASPTTVLLSTHHVDEVERLADHIGVLQNGTLRAQLPIDALRAGLLRYRAQVPAGWLGAPSFNGSVVRQSAANREIDWVVWGDETQVTAGLSRAGAQVRECSAVTLSDATLALLTTH